LKSTHLKIRKWTVPQFRDRGKRESWPYYEYGNSEM